MYKLSFGLSRQRVKLSEFTRFNFAYNPGRILNMFVFLNLYSLSFWLISICFAEVFAIPKKLAFGGLEVAITQKQKLSRHRGYSAKSRLSVWYFHPRGDFKAKVGEAGATARRGEIKQQEVVRQNIENITRIGPTGSLRVVQKMCFLIPAGILKQKLRRV